MPPRPVHRPPLRLPAPATDPPAAPAVPRPPGTGRAVLGRLREMAAREDEAPDVARAIRRLLKE